LDSRETPRMVFMSGRLEDQDHVRRRRRRAHIMSDSRELARMEFRRRV
jgi:hypothetical protein